MATAFTITPYINQKGFPGMVMSSKGKATIGTGVVTADTWTFENMLPNINVLIVGGRISGQEFDTDATPTATVIIGDGTDTDGYLTSKTAGTAQTNGQYYAEFDGALLGGSAQASVDLVVTLGGTVATAASSGDFFLEVDYDASDV